VSDENGENALDLAIKKGHNELVELIEKARVAMFL